MAGPPVQCFKKYGPFCLVSDFKENVSDVLLLRIKFVFFNCYIWMMDRYVMRVYYASHSIILCLNIFTM